MPLLTYPPGFDPAVYSYVGQGLLDGYLPYRDAWAQNAPANFFLYAAAHAVLGRDFLVVKVLTLTQVCATAVLVYLTGRLFVSRGLGAVAALVWVLTYLGTTHWIMIGEPELAMGWLTLLCLLLAHRLASRGVQHPVPWLLLGALSMLPALFKPTGIATLFVITIAAWLWSPSPRKQRLYQTALAFGGGGLLVAICWWWLMATGAWPFFIEDVVVFNLRYVSPARLGFALYPFFFFYHLITLGPVGLLALVVSPLVLRSFGPSRSYGIVMLLLGMAVVSAAVIQRKYYIYHMQYALPILSLFASLVLIRLPSMWANPRHWPLAVAILAWLVGGTLFLPWERYDSYGRGIKALSQPAFEPRWEGRLGLYAKNKPAEALILAHHIDTSGTPDQNLFAGSQVSLYLLTNRRAPTRYFNVVILAYGGNAQARAVTRQILNELESAPPEFIETPNESILATSKDLSLEDRAALEQLVGFLHKHGYERQAETEALILWRRRG